MAQSQLALYNLALHNSGVGKSVDSLAENSPEAIECRLWYETIRDMVFRAGWWPATKAAKRIGVLAERDEDEDWVASDPLPGWRYAYAFPSDGLAPRYMSDYAQFDMGIYDNKRAILTQAEEAVLIYTKRETNVELWDVGLYMSVMHALSSYITIPLTGKKDLMRINVERANAYILQARSDSQNDTSAIMETIPDWIAARGYMDSTGPVRFVFPFGPLIGYSGVPVA